MGSPRLTVRRWMLVIALVALALETEAVHRRWNYCQDAAGYYGIAATVWLAEADSPPQHRLCSSEADAVRKGIYSLPTLPTLAEHRESCLRKARYHLAIKRKFERAAWQFWKTVPTEPPLPSMD
jgi:hypothetical protein